MINNSLCGGINVGERNLLRKNNFGGTQVAQLGIHPLVLAQVMISLFLGSSPAWDSLCLSVSALLLLSLSLSLKINKLKK